VRQVVAVARTLDELAHKEDPTRVTVISANRSYSDIDVYEVSGLLDIPDVVGWHMYFGWYYGAFRDLGGFLDDQHRRFPTRKIFISEYGADNDRRLHSLKPLIGDGTVEWAHLYHMNYVPQIEARSYLAGSAVWIQNDFGSEERGGTVPHLNTKGIFTYDRKPKDIYYYYKALFSAEPVLHLATRDWAIRQGAKPSDQSDHGEQPLSQPVEIFTNLSAVELFINGKSLGSKLVNTSRHTSWDVPFRSGLNLIEARGRAGSRTVSDKAEVRFIYRAAFLADPSVPFDNLAVNVGSNAQFIDAGGAVWEADQPYKLGGWGYIGGAPGTATQNVLDSTADPLYQTVRQGLKAYRFDVPDGRYEVQLYFLEHRFTKPGERVFSVSLNGKTVIDKLDLVKEYGWQRAASRNFQVSVEQGQGVTVDFAGVVGDPVLSAVLVRKLR
jgi:beta-galactosidase